MLKCSDNSYYVGSTEDLERRIHEHEKGYSSHTSRRLPIELVYSQRFGDKSYAKKREKQLKGWTRLKKEALIKDARLELHQLAECKNDTSYKNKNHERN